MRKVVKLQADGKMNDHYSQYTPQMLEQRIIELRVRTEQLDAAVARHEQVRWKLHKLGRTLTQHNYY
jgi:hypothetical protein